MRPGSRNRFQDVAFEAPAAGRVPTTPPNAKVTKVPANVVVRVRGWPYYVDNLHGGDELKTHAAEPRPRALRQRHEAR